jgi:hypothetical protein
MLRRKAMNYFEFQKKFPTEKAVIDYFIKIRYNDNVVCPKCGKTEGVYHCHTEPKKIHYNHLYYIVSKSFSRAIC